MHFIVDVAVGMDHVAELVAEAFRDRHGTVRPHSWCHGKECVRSGLAEVAPPA
jgi:hypothetical protein